MKTKKQLLDKRLLFTSIITFFLMILFFSTTYWNSQRSTINNNTDCQKASNTISADGLVVINEADLRCAGVVERDRSSEEIINLASITLGLICAGLTLLFLSLNIKNHYNK